MGRPRKIQRDQAIDRALKVFWEKGYEQTSIADLSAALEGGPSSIYNAFGNKESLFRLAIERYVAQYTGFLAAAELDLDVEPLVLEVLRGAARAYTSPNLPPGCAIMQSGGAPGARHSRAAAITLEVKAAVEQQLERALARAAKTHDLVVVALAGVDGLAVAHAVCVGVAYARSLSATLGLAAALGGAVRVAAALDADAELLVALLRSLAAVRVVATADARALLAHAALALAVVRARPRDAAAAHDHLLIGLRRICRRV